MFIYKSNTVKDTLEGVLHTADISLYAEFRVIEDELHLIMMQDRETEAPKLTSIRLEKLTGAIFMVVKYSRGSLEQPQPPPTDSIVLSSVSEMRSSPEN